VDLIDRLIAVNHCYCYRYLQGPFLSPTPILVEVYVYL